MSPTWVIDWESLRIFYKGNVVGTIHTWLPNPSRIQWRGQGELAGIHRVDIERERLLDDVRRQYRLNKQANGKFLPGGSQVR